MFDDFAAFVCHLIKCNRWTKMESNKINNGRNRRGRTNDQRVKLMKAWNYWKHETETMKSNQLIWFMYFES